MIKDYSLAPKMAEDKKGPSKTILQFILNYSKSIEVKKAERETMLVHLN